MIERFRNYLDVLDIRLGNMFEKQAPFVKCKKGCAYCCKECECTLSELEYINLMLFYNTLSAETRGIINANIANLIKKKRQKFYECPFLIEGSCSIYPARPIICRTFGLITLGKNKKPKIPFCMEIGLNDSDITLLEQNIMDKCEKNIDDSFVFNVDRRTLRDREKEEIFNIFFGEDKSLIEWLKEDDFYTK